MLGKGALEHLGQKTGVGLVVYALALLFFNHLALGIYAHLINFCVQHALRLHPQAELELVGGQ